MLLADWLEHMKTLIQKLNLLDLGYPQGDHTVHPPNEALLQEMITDSRIDRDSPLVEFYTHCDGVDLPDVHNGYFIHRLELITRSLVNGEPTRVQNNTSTSNILVFGSDGGGGRFAIVTDAPHEILYLPTGAVHDAIFDCTTVPCTVLSADFMGFLKRLLADVEAFIERRDDWDYMAR